MTGLYSHCGAAALALAVVACSSAGRGGVETAPEPSTAEPGGQTAANAKPYGGRYPYTQADVQFMSGMIQHHAQALVMAGWAPTHGASPAVRRLAERIINGQQDEIATIEQWLRDRRQPLPDSGAAGAMDHSAHFSGHMQMPGMLTQAQMQQLDQARGAEFDRLFLTFMIQHHRGAVTMVEDLFGTPGAAQDETTFKLASDVSADQSSEITRMDQMLASLPFPSRSP
jgi:uncharacterized protein (DUF305 family)